MKDLNSLIAAAREVLRVFALRDYHGLRVSMDQLRAATPTEAEYPLEREWIHVGDPTPRPEHYVRSPITEQLPALPFCWMHLLAGTNIFDIQTASGIALDALCKIPVRPPGMTDEQTRGFFHSSVPPTEAADATRDMLDMLSRVPFRPTGETDAMPRNITLPTENDCEDQGFTKISEGCFKCLPTFENGQPMRQKLVQVERRNVWYWECPKCQGSYGMIGSVTAEEARILQSGSVSQITVPPEGEG